MPPEMQSFTEESIAWAKITHPDDTKSMADLLVNKMAQNYGEGWNAFIQTKGEECLRYFVHPKSSTFLQVIFEDYIFTVYKAPWKIISVWGGRCIIMVI